MPTEDDNGWDDDDADWGSLEVEAKIEADQSHGGHKFVSTTEHTPASSYNWDQNKPTVDDDQFFNSLITNNKNISVGF